MLKIFISITVITFIVLFILFNGSGVQEYNGGSDAPDDWYTKITYDPLIYPATPICISLISENKYSIGISYSFTYSFWENFRQKDKITKCVRYSGMICWAIFSMLLGGIVIFIVKVIKNRF
jgi:hypothetical protein